MRTAKLIFIVLFSVILSGNAEAQIFKRLKKAVERGVENTIERKVRRKTEEKTEDAMDVILGDKKKKNNSENTTETDSYPESEDANAGSLEEEDPLLEEVDSGSSFKRGNIILFEDNFSRDAVGDFPAKWNTNQGGEVKNLTGYDEKWLRVPAGSSINLELSKPLPPNFTIEFDMIVPADIPLRMAAFALGEKPERLGYTLASEHSYAFMLYSNEKINNKAIEYGLRGDDNLKRFRKKYNVPLNKKIHAGIVVNNNERIRLYLDGVKMTDAPRGFSPKLAKSFFFNAMTHGGTNSKKNYFYVSNVVVAETGTDKRSLVMKELLEKGTFTTSDILFDSGSDKIQASSANILNQIGEAMKTAPNAQFLIIGHTDSDGSDSANQILSQKRAESVKNYLVEKFNINGSKLMCVGKGESEPVSSNNTAAGKAQNRRVEFKKL